MKNNRDFPLRTAGVAAVIAVLLLVLSILGNVRISGYLKASMEESAVSLMSLVTGTLALGP